MGSSSGWVATAGRRQAILLATLVLALSVLAPSAHAFSAILAHDAMPARIADADTGAVDGVRTHGPGASHGQHAYHDAAAADAAGHGAHRGAGDDCCPGDACGGFCALVCPGAGASAIPSATPFSSSGGAGAPQAMTTADALAPGVSDTPFRPPIGRRVVGG